MEGVDNLTCSASVSSVQGVDELLRAVHLNLPCWEWMKMVCSAPEPNKQGVNTANLTSSAPVPSVEGVDKPDVLCICI